MRNKAAGVFLGAILLLSLPVSLSAQTASTAAISGTVSDPTGAVVPGASVELTDLATNLSRSQQTNAAGQYMFANVNPGTYKLSVTMQGFRQASVPSLKVEVAKTYTMNFTLEVGAMAEVVEVTAGAGVELQTQDSTVGNVIRSDYLMRLPIIDRQANSLYSLQPTVTPQNYGFNASGAVAGARADQSTWAADGIDVTQGKFPDTGDVTTMPLPAESIEEFRAGVTNVNATFGRSGGGQFNAVRKRGGNAFHGSAYLYEQNDNLNANTWTRNRSRQRDPELKDHRFGVSIGGPIIKEKTFFFFNYEGRRFPRSADLLRFVPSSTLRQGILRFRDAAGTIISYPLATSTVCGATRTSPCDPRGIGLNPVISALWGFMPPANDPASGDGLNTVGFRGIASTSVESEVFLGARRPQLYPELALGGQFRLGAPPRR